MAKYNETRVGVAGEIGTGRYGVRYLQSAIPIQEIDTLTLVSELPDSERWHVRQLFQRDIDKKRVLEEIMPYFKHAQKIKFFNPLTIVLMPMDNSGRVLCGVGEDESSATLQDGTPVRICEADGHYKLTWPAKSYPYGSVEYNTKCVKLVAVDGQHRLSALKRLWREHHATHADPTFTKVGFENWRIPVVLLIFPPLAKGAAKPQGHVLLENVRDIFVTINTNAQRPNRCREILLNDYSVTAICCQELLDFCHKENSPLPLLFFDWRAHDRSEDNFYPENEHAFLRVEELEDYHIHYLLSESQPGVVLSQKQRDALFFDSISPAVDENDQSALREAVRKRYRETLMPAVVHVFSTFKPFASYADFLKQLQTDLDTDIKKYAMNELLYGIHHAPENLYEAIAQMVNGMKKRCEAKKKELPRLFTNIIGGRAIFAGLALAHASKSEAEKKTPPWKDAAQWYVEHMNRAYDDGLFNYDQKLLRHIAVDHNDHVVNYRLPDQDDAFGAYCALIACARSNGKGQFLEEINTYLNALEDTIFRGFKKELRPQIKDTNPGMDRAEINRLVEKRAREKTNAQVKSLKAALKINDS